MTDRNHPPRRRPGLATALAGRALAQRPYGVSAVRLVADAFGPYRVRRGRDRPGPHRVEVHAAVT